MYELKQYFFELADSQIPCNGVLPSGCRIPLPSSGDYWAITEFQNSENRLLVMAESKQSYNNYDDMFLPYAPSSINICIQSNRNIISAPFSGCHLVMFENNEECIFDVVNGANNKCPKRGFGCLITCPLRYKKLVSHVAYEKNPKYSCQELWNNLKKTNKVLIDIEPYSGVNQSICENRHCWVYAIITPSLECFSVTIGDDDKIKSLVIHK